MIAISITRSTVAIISSSVDSTSTMEGNSTIIFARKIPSSIPPSFVSCEHMEGNAFHVVVVIGTASIVSLKCSIHIATCPEF
jgi:hypothetical protein